MTQSQKGVKTLKKNICKGLLLVMLVAALAGCNGDTKQRDPVMQSASTTAPTVGSTTPAPTTGTVPLPSPQSTTAPTTAPPSLPSSGVTTAPSTAPTTLPTTVTTQPGHVCTFTSTEIDATCTAGSYIIWKCACGKTDQDITSNPLGHKYGEWISNNDATCVKDGTKTRKCERCGNPESKPDVGSKKNAEHDYQFVKLYLATPWTDGCDLYKCTLCKKEDERNVIHLDEEAASAWLREAEAATLKYLNQYRVEIGSPEMTMLPGLSEVMRYRAHQIYLNGANSLHDKQEEIAAFDKFKYGDYCEPSWTEEELNALKQAGLTPSFDPHYFPDGSEASAYVGCIADTPDAFGLAVAKGFKESPKDHWRYLQLANNSYAGIGYEYNPNFGVTICIWVTNKDYDAISANN